MISGFVKIRGRATENRPRDCLGSNVELRPRHTILRPRLSNETVGFEISKEFGFRYSLEYFPNYMISTFGLIEFYRLSAFNTLLVGWLM